MEEVFAYAALDEADVAVEGVEEGPAAEKHEVDVVVSPALGVERVVAHLVAVGQVVHGVVLRLVRERVRGEVVLRVEDGQVV